MAFIKQERKRFYANKIKLALMEYFKEYFVITEFKNKIDGYEHIDDFVAFNEKKVIVVEIKTSKEDFLRDFNKFRHKALRERLYYNQFYFCVPARMQSLVCEYLENNHFMDYGILLVNDDYSIFRYNNATFLNPINKGILELDDVSNKLDKNCLFYALIKRMNIESINLFKQIKLRRLK